MISSRQSFDHLINTDTCHVAVILGELMHKNIPLSFEMSGGWRKSEVGVLTREFRIVEIRTRGCDGGIQVWRLIGGRYNEVLL